MAALTQGRMKRETNSKHRAFPLAAGQSVFTNGMACYDTSSHTIKKAASGNANLVKIGEFDETVDNSAGTTTVNVLVDLDRELVTRSYDNDTGGNAVTTANLFSNVYLLDDHTVTTVSSGNSVAGKVWGVDAINGVEIETSEPI